VSQPAEASALATRLAAYIAARTPGEGEARVDGLDRIPGGASRETYRFQLFRRLPGAEETGPRRLILRKDPPGKTLVASERELEFGVYRGVFGTGVPVPEVLWLEDDAAPLGTPFFIAVEVTGCEADVRKLASPEYLPLRGQIAERKWSILGQLSRIDPEARGLFDVLPPVALDQCWTRELDYWEGVLNADEIAPQPITRAAIRWLRANPPPPAARLSLVHGDYRTGNFLYAPDGDIHAILDWEMSHLGDPLEDLAWSLARPWCFGRDDMRGNLAPLEDAVAIWEQASGLKADPDALKWWRLFSVVKGQGIWASSAMAWRSGATPELMLALTAWACVNTQDREALELMGRL
jgi:aminoglycoside phosphotransferase (APT) family kinase protein